MHFLTQTTSNGINISRILNASSWSNCISFLEGTGEEILQINFLTEQTNVVVAENPTTNCFNVVLKDTSSTTKNYFYVFRDNFTDLNNWISQQVGKEVFSISLSQKTYVNV